MTTRSVHHKFAVVPGKVINAALFNLSWFAILATQSTVLAAAIAALHLAVHGIFFGRGGREWLLIAGVTLLGVVLDQLLFLSGVFNLSSAHALAPLWLTCLWPVFATTLMHAFEPFQHRPYVSAVLGAVGGVLSYTAGVHLTAIQFGSPLWGPIIIGLLWAVLFPLLLMFAARLQRSHDPLQSWEPAARRALD